VLSIFLLFGSWTPVSATTHPTYTAVGTSWVDVPSESKIYFDDDDSEWDDTGLFYLPAGESCSYMVGSASGPAVVAQGCAGVPEVGIPLGFTINFFGNSHSSVLANTNGSLSFTYAYDSYDETGFRTIVPSLESSVLLAYAVDLEHRTVSNFWFAQTTIDGKQAAVFSWENYRPYSDNTNLLSFQVVIVNLGGGDFDAYFNYDKITGGNTGYQASRFWIDLSDDVTVGSNIVRTGYASSLPLDCTRYVDTTYYPDEEDFTDQAFLTATGDFFAKRESSTSMSFWSDPSCSGSVNAINAQALQNVSRDGNGYIEYRTFDSTGLSPAIGWGVFKAPDLVDVTELFPNTLVSALANGGAKELISQSINTSVVGRIVLGQRGGVTVGDPNDPESPAFEESVAPVSVKSDRLPRFDQEGTVLGTSEGSLLLTGHRLYCTTDIKINNSPASFSHSAMPAGDGRAKLEITLPKLEPGFHQISMDSCGGFVTYDRFLYVSKAPAVMQGKVGNSLERANLMIRLQQWARENRSDYNSVECIINTRSLSQENAKSLAKDMCSKTFGRLASPKSYVLTIRENPSHVQIWYKVILSNQ